MQGHKKLMDELGRKSVDEFHAAQKLPLVIVLDEVRSMHNVGSVFRTADSFLIEAIYLCGYTPQPPHRDIQKTALGATESVIWKHVGSTLDAVEQLKNEDYVIISIEQVHGSISLADYAFDKTKKYALIFGNEVNGVQQKVISLSDASIEIPQLGSKHSLNIAVSVGVVIWEFAKRFL
jgi:tRNA G18 (ribose-2'-O)-methylase SpoU